MDIAAMSIGMHAAAAENAVQLSVLKMAMNTGEEQSGGVINMMNNMSVEPYKGENIDATV